MKKLVTVLLVVALVAVMAIPAFAATGINANEQAVLDKLSECKEMGAKQLKFYIPDKYITSAKNYFIGDCDMTEDEKNAIIAYIDEGAAIVKKEADGQAFEGQVYNLNTMSQESRSAVLVLGQKACAEVDLNLVYNSAENKVVITTVKDGTVVFESAPVVKTTGEDFPITAATIGLAVVLTLAAGTAMMLVVSKRKGLLVK